MTIRLDNLAAILSVSDWLSRGTTNSHVSFASHFAHPDATFFSPAPTLRTLLACLIKAYEIQGTLQALNEFNEHGLDHVLLVKVASIAVISPLLGLSKDQALAAVSQAWQDGSPLRIYRQAPNTSARKGWAAGDAASRAVHLALLTSQGQQGSPTVLSCPKWGFRDVCFAGKEIKLPRPYGTKVVETVFFKIVPAEGHGLSAIEAALDIVSQLDSRGIVFGHGRNWDLINRIEIRTTKAGHSIINKSGPLRGYADRDHCLQYMVAVALLKGSVIDCPDYDDSSPWASDPRVDALRGKMIVVEDASFTRDYYDPKVRSAANQVIITLQDSTQLEARRDYALGHHSNPQTLPSVRAKYHHNLGMKFQEPRVSLIEKTVMTPGCWDMKVCEFVDLLVVPEAISISDIPYTPGTSPSVVTLLAKCQGQTSNERSLERIEHPQIHSTGSVSPTLHEAQSICLNDSPPDMEKLGETKHVAASRKSRCSVLGYLRRFRPCRSLRRLMQKI